MNVFLVLNAMMFGFNLYGFIRAGLEKNTTVWMLHTAAIYINTIAFIVAI